MDLGKFYRIVSDLNSKIATTGIQAHFNSITQSLQRMTQGQVTPQVRTQSQTAIENARREINVAINTLIPSSLSEEDSKMYEALGAYALFGFEGQQRFSKIFQQLSSNPAAVTQGLQPYIQEVNQIVQLHNSFAPYQQRIPSISKQHEQSNLITLFFQSGAEINNLDEFAKVSQKWNQILISFAMLARENDTAFRIETVERGSIILTLSGIAAIVIAFGKGSNLVLDAVKKYYEIKKLAAEAKLLKGVPEKTIHELENASKLKLKTETTEITKRLIELYAWNEETQRKDVDSGIRIAIRYMLEFINKGGKIDIKLIESTPENKEMESTLSLKYSQIKAIEKIISPDGDQPQMLELTEGEEEIKSEETGKPESTEPV